MSNTIKLKRSDSAAAVPSDVDLEYGELALNYQDGNLFFKNSSNTVQTIASTQFVDVSGNVTGGNIITAGQISATGNITGGNILSDGYYYANGDPFVSGFSEFRTAFGNLEATSNSVVLFNAANGISVSANVSTSTISVGVLPGLNGSFDFGFVTESANAGFDMGTLA